MDLAWGAGSLMKAAKASRAAKAAFAEGEAADAFVKGYKPSGGPGGAAGASTPIEPLLLDPPNIVVSKVQPLSVSQVIKDTNIDKARGLHSAMAAADTGSVAKADRKSTSMTYSH